MSETERPYLPAAGSSWALPLYDPLVSLLGIDGARKSLLQQAGLKSSQCVLDVGCGTGTMAVLIKRNWPEVDVTGLDPDSGALALAGRKAARAGANIRFDRGFADRLPYADASFDRVFSSFMYHHLAMADREKMLREARRVLKPGGSFHLLDLKGGDDGKQGWLTHLFHGHDQLKDNSESKVIALLREAGFTNVRKVIEKAIAFGALRVNYFQAN